MDWSLYDNGLRHERVNDYEQKLFFNPLNAIVAHIQNICAANQWTGFYMKTTLAFNGLRIVSKGVCGRQLFLFNKSSRE